MKTDVVVHLTALSNVNGKISLREGSSVYVRIIKNNGNNSYLASFSGGRFLLKSGIPLSEGTGFLARLKIENGKIILQKLQQVPENKNSIHKITQENQSQFLEKMGLIPDSLSFSMLQQMKMLGARFSLDTFQKIRKIAEKLKGREKTASDVAFILEEKGIPADDKKVSRILGNDAEPDNGAEEIFPEKYGIPPHAKNPFRDFFEKILNLPENEKNQPGILTLFNQTGFCFGTDPNYSHSENGFGSWIRIPFEFNVEEKGGNGSFCGFLGNGSKKLEKAVVYFNVRDKKYVFEFALNGNDLLYLNAGVLDSAANKILLEILKSRFEKTKLGPISSVGDFSEFSADNIEVKSVNLSV